MKKMSIILLLLPFLLWAQTPEEIKSRVDLELLALPELPEEDSTASVQSPVSVPAVTPRSEIQVTPAARAFPLSLAMDSLSLQTEIFGCAWLAGEDETIGTLSSGDLVQITESTWLKTQGSDSLLFTPVFRDGHLTAMSVRIILSGMKGQLSADSLFSSVRHWLEPRFGHSRSVELRDFNPALRRGNALPLKRINWKAGNATLSLLLEYDSPDRLYLNFSFPDTVKAVNVGSRLDKLFE